MSDENAFGDFEEIQEKTAGAVKGGQQQATLGQEPVRVRMPRGNEKVGIIAQRYGGNRMEVKCTDGKTRNCRIPGRFKRSLWLRPNDIVLVQPWPDNDEKGDVVFKYMPNAVSQLRKKGILKDIEGGF